MGKSTLLSIIVAGIVLLASVSSYSQTIECDGTAGSGTGNFGGDAPCPPLRYMYKIDDTSFVVPETLYIGTHDGTKANYINVCLSPGWQFSSIDAITQDDYDGFTLHGNLSAGPDGTCPFVMLLIRTGSSSLPFYFGFDHDLGPHDVGWEIFGNNPATEDWNSPVGDGVGAVHAPKFDTCYTVGDVNGDGLALSVADLIYLQAFVRGLGPAPIPLWAGDLNADGYIDALDVIIFKEFFISGISVFPQFPIPTNCNPDTVRGACCLGDTCLVLSQFNCEDTTGIYFDNAMLCENFACSSSLGGLKFEDYDCDGVKDSNDTPIWNVPVHLYQSTPAWVLVDSTVTDSVGRYEFTGLPLGKYAVTEKVQPGWVQTFPPTVTYVINLEVPQDLDTFDFGNTKDTCEEPSYVDFVIQEAGTRDNFVGEEPSSPDLVEDLVGVLNCDTVNFFFDSPQNNSCFAHTFVDFKDSLCCVIGAQLCLRIKGSSGVTSTDAIGIAEDGAVAWSISLNNLQSFMTGGIDNIWSSGDIIDTCFDLANLPPGYKGVTNVLAALQDNDFSVYMGDDTEVDFLELTVELCCEPKSCVVFDTECCDGKPTVAQRQDPPNFRDQVAVASCYSDTLFPDPFVVGIVDLTEQCDAPRGTPPGSPAGFEPPMYHNEMPNPSFNSDDVWTIHNLGTVFGLALDNNGNIYAAATACYDIDVFPGAATGGEVYRLNGETGAIVSIVPGAIPNSGQGLGNIAYDCLHDRLFVSNMEDGLIYSIVNVGTAPTLGPTYDHGVDGRPNEGLTPIADDASSNFTSPGRRIWGLAVAKGTAKNGVNFYRLFYSVYWEDTGNQLLTESNEIWSVGMNTMTGNFLPLTARLEISLPDYGAIYSNPVSDITLKADGRIILAERSMTDTTLPNAHKSRILEYACEEGIWVRQKNTDVPPVDIFQIPADDMSNPNPSAAGGVDIDFRTDYDSLCEGQLWATGDAFRFFSNPPATLIYGLAGFPPAGGSTAITTPAANAAILIDLDGDVITADKTEIGDVELPCKCCGGSKGDFNGDGFDSNILDLTYCVDFIFRGGPRPPCDDESDINSDGDPINILDLTFLVDFIFRGGQAAGPCN